MSEAPLLEPASTTTTTTTTTTTIPTPMAKTIMHHHHHVDNIDRDRLHQPARHQEYKHAPPYSAPPPEQAHVMTGMPLPREHRPGREATPRQHSTTPTLYDTTPPESSSGSSSSNNSRKAPPTPSSSRLPSYPATGSDTLAPSPYSSSSGMSAPRAPHPPPPPTPNAAAAAISSPPERIAHLSGDSNVPASSSHTPQSQLMSSQTQQQGVSASGWLVPRAASPPALKISFEGAFFNLFFHLRY